MACAQSWEKSRLGSLFQSQKGFAFKSAWYCETGYPIVKVSDFTRDSIDASSLTYIPPEIAKQHLRYRLQEGDVVIQTVGSWPSNPASVVGKCVRVPRSVNMALLNQNAVRLDPNDRIEKSFLYYSLRSPQFCSYIVGTAQGAASQAAITLDAIRDFELSLPPVPTQRKIAAILSAYDDLIENNLRRIKILEEMAQNLYREWFVKFRFPGHQHARFTDSPLGPIPEGWEVKLLGEILELSYGKALKQEDRREGCVPVYGSSGVVGYHDMPLVKGPGIIVGRKGNVGSVFWSEDDFFPIDTVYFVRSEMPLRFLFYDLQTKNFLNNDAAVPGLNRNQAYSLETVKPPADTLARFCEMADDFERQAAILRLQNSTLRRTRDLLLPKLISGEVDVSGLNIAIPEEAEK